MKPYFLFVLVIFISSCSIKTDQTKVAYSIDLTSKLLNPSDKNNYSYANFYNYLKIFQIPNSLGAIGRINHVITDEYKIYAVDRQYARAIFILNLDGELLHKISKYGKGPGEFLDITDITICNNILYIYDRKNKKIVKYNTQNYSYLGEVKFDFDFTYFERNEYFTYYQTVTSNKIPFWLVVENNETKKKKYYFSKYDYKLHQMPKISKTLFKYKDKVVFCHPFLSKIYSFERDTLKTHININGVNISHDILKSQTDKSLDYIDDIFENSTGIFSDYFENDDFIRFTYRNKSHTPLFAIYDKKYHKYSLQHRFVDNIGNGGSVLYGLNTISISRLNIDFISNFTKNGVDTNLIINKNTFRLPEIDFMGNPVLFIYRKL